MALRATGSRLVLDECSLRGGDGISEIGRATGGSLALRVDSSWLVAKRSTFQGGNGGFDFRNNYHLPGGGGLSASDSNLRLESTSVRGGFGAARIQETGCTIIERPGSLPPSTRFAPSSIELLGQPGSGAVLLVSLNTTFVPLASYIGVLELRDFVLVGPGLIQSNGIWSVAATIPPDLISRTVFAQHAVFDQSDLWLTTATQMLVR